MSAERVAHARGSWSRVWGDLPLRWFFTGMIFYFVTCVQCAFQTTLTMQALIHFTDWVVGHAHLVMFGVFGFWLLGMMTYLIPRFRDLQERYPDSFAAHFGELTPENETVKCAEALREGRRVYIAEGCWHCHSQFVRPVSQEARRWGPVPKSREYQNELQRPVMFGTRRVGPDLSREGGRNGNGWHVVHFFRPKMTSPDSVMPEYPWFFQGNTPDGPGQPNRKGIAITTYMQWLGSRLPKYFDNYGTVPQVTTEDLP